MNEELIQQLIANTERLTNATEMLNHVLESMNAGHSALESKIERIVAAIEEQAPGKADMSAEERRELQGKIADLERANQELKTQAGRLARKTLPALATAVLSKSGLDGTEGIDPAALDKALNSLSVEQRIAVKAQMAQAGIIG